MPQDYWWAIVVALALAAALVAWLVLGRRRGVGSEAAESLRDLDGSRAARPTFARTDPLAAPPPLATGSSVAAAEPLSRGGPADAAPPIRDGAVEGAADWDGVIGSSAAAMEDAAAEPEPATGDDLTRMKGLGPKLRDRLAELGVTRFDQIAGWDDADIDRVDAELGAFAGRIRRDDWVEQARFLAAGDRAGYEARFGALG